MRTGNILSVSVRTTGQQFADTFQYSRCSNSEQTGEGIVTQAISRPIAALPQITPSCVVTETVPVSTRPVTTTTVLEPFTTHTVPILVILTMPQWR